MPSSSLLNFIELQKKAILLRKKAGLARKKEDRHAKSILLHSALTFNVSSWDAYVNNIIREFINKIQNLENSEYSKLHELVRYNADISLQYFNTPNHENTRNILLKCTGYDPYPDWIWTKKGWTALETREFLNEILKVRHSFAHGFTMPHFDWNPDSFGNAYLTCSILALIESFFKNLSKNTDRGLKKFIFDNYNVDPWS